MGPVVQRLPRIFRTRWGFSGLIGIVAFFGYGGWYLVQGKGIVLSLVAGVTFGFRGLPVLLVCVRERARALTTDLWTTRHNSLANRHDAMSAYMRVIPGSIPVAGLQLLNRCGGLTPTDSFVTVHGEATAPSVLSCQAPATPCPSCRAAAEP